MINSWTLHSDIVSWMNLANMSGEKALVAFILQIVLCLHNHKIDGEEEECMQSITAENGVFYEQSKLAAQDDFSPIKNHGK